jgi:hypothetical protein
MPVILDQREGTAWPLHLMANLLWEHKLAGTAATGGVMTAAERGMLSLERARRLEHGGASEPAP